MDRQRSGADERRGAKGVRPRVHRSEYDRPGRLAGTHQRRGRPQAPLVYNN
ncbi:MAG: hypothetical protein WKF31_08960 [Thermoleophilaceae bacterium]